MISASGSKLIKSLRLKKYREQHHLYVVEGEKMVLEMLTAQPGETHRLHRIYANRGWLDQHRGLIRTAGISTDEASPSELKKVSNLVTPQPVLALACIPEEESSPGSLRHPTVLALESIRDPGNLGTIVRTAGWFGIRHIVCSPDSVDLFSPKVVQSTMGALWRVQVHYMDIGALLAEPGLEGKPVYGTFLEGDDIYSTTFPRDPMILFGNESRGLSDRYNKLIHHRITIPSFAAKGKGCESLNVASSVAVVCSEISRSG